MVVDNVAFIVGLLAGVGTLALTFKLIFKNPGDFADALTYSGKIDLLFLSPGELEKHLLAGARMGLWVLPGVIVGGTVGAVFAALFD